MIVLLLSLLLFPSLLWAADQGSVVLRPSADTVDELNMRRGGLNLARMHSHATNCSTGVTVGIQNDPCYDNGAAGGNIRFWVCRLPAVGGNTGLCDLASEWAPLPEGGGEGGGGGGATVPLTVALTGMSGATAVATSAIPPSIVFAVFTEITTTITGADLSGIRIGDGVDPDRWGRLTTLTAGTLTTVAHLPTTHTAMVYPTGSNIVLTPDPADAVFTAGAVRFTIHYTTGAVGGGSPSGVNLRGLLASRPAAGIPGREYCATDSGAEVCYHDTGATWEVKPLAYTQVTGKPAGLITGIQNEGTNVTAQPTLNMTGAGVDCTNDSGNSRTNCNISGASVTAYDRIQNEGVNLTQRQTLNMIGAGIDCVDNSGASRTDCTVSASGGSGFPPASQQRVHRIHAGAMTVLGSSPCTGAIDAEINGRRRPTITNCPDSNAALIDFDVPIQDITETDGPGWNWNLGSVRVYWQTLTTATTPAGVFGVKIACRCLSRAGDTMQPPSMDAAPGLTTNYSATAQYSYRSPSLLLTTGNGGLILGNCSATDYSELQCRAQVDASTTDSSYQPMTTHIVQANIEWKEVWQP